MLLFLQEFLAIPSPAIQQECSSSPRKDEEIRHAQEKASVGQQVLTLPSFLKPLFRVTVEIYKISSKNNPSVVPFQVDCDYCLDDKRNNRNSTGWCYLCIQWRKVEFPVAHRKLKFHALLQEVLFALAVHSVGVREYRHYKAQAEESVLNSGALNSAFFILGRQRSGNKYVAMVTS